MTRRCAPSEAATCCGSAPQHVDDAAFIVRRETTLAELAVELLRNRAKSAVDSEFARQAQRIFDVLEPQCRREVDGAAMVAGHETTHVAYHLRTRCLTTGYRIGHRVHVQ